MVESRLLNRVNQRSKTIQLKTSDEISLMWEANQIVAEVLSFIKKIVEPGITTFELDAEAEAFCLRRNAVPAFKGYRGFSGSLCVSINDEVVHGIPSKKRRLTRGDVVSVDFGVLYKGFYGDSAVTFPVDVISDENKKLLAVTEESLNLAIEEVKEGNRVSDISRAVQLYVEKNGFSVVRQFVGHGIGSSLHEPPEIPNYVQSGSSPRILNGMVFAIEPMVNVGTCDVKVLKDGWTVVTADRKNSAHFEHSVAATAHGPLVLSKTQV